MAIKAVNQIDVIDLTDGYSVILTNDSHTFLGTTTSVNGTQTTTTQVMALCGSEQVPYLFLFQLILKVCRKTRFHVG